MAARPGARPGRAVAAARGPRGEGRGGTPYGDRRAVREDARRGAGRPEPTGAGRAGRDRASAPGAAAGQAGEPEENRRRSGERTSTDLVRSTNGSPAMRSSTRSKWRMSEAKTWTIASASPVTVEADAISG